MAIRNLVNVEDLGNEATESDLEQFVMWAKELVDRGMSEQEAIDTLFGDGDYFRSASRLGLSEPTAICESCRQHIATARSTNPDWCGYQLCGECAAEYNSRAEA